MQFLRDKFVGIIKNQPVQKLIENASIASVLHYAVFRFLQSTTFSFVYTDVYKTITLLLLVTIGGLHYICLAGGKYLEAQSRNKKKSIALEIIRIIFLSIPFVIVGWKNNYKFLIFLPFCVLCLYKVEHRKICRLFCLTIGIMLASTVICALAGSVRNIVSPSGHVYASYGIINTSDFASYFVFLLLAGWCSKQKNHSRSRAFLFPVFSLLIITIVYVLTGSKTSLICGAMIVFFCIWDIFEDQHMQTSHFFNITRKCCDILSIAAFPLLMALVCILVYLYSQQIPWANNINQILSDRLRITYEPIKMYGIHPFGVQIESMHGNGATIIPASGWSSGYSYIDIGYAMLFIRYGWILAVEVTCIWVWMSLCAIRTGNRKVAIALMIIAFHAISEARILDINYNVFLVLPLCTMETNAQKRVALEISKEKKWPRYVITTCICLGLCFCFPGLLSWLRTFFYLKNWNAGTNAIYALILCVILILFMLGGWKSVNMIIQQACINRRKVLLFGSMCLTAIIVTFSIMNVTIEKGLKDQSTRLDAEEKIIKEIQEKATLPVYVAEQSELYNRRYGGFDNHVFSTEELPREPKGTMIADSSIDAQAITWSKGLYTQLSEWSGIYTYDPSIIDLLREKGYTLKPFYTGWKIFNLYEVAKHNGRTPTNRLVLQGPCELITKDMEVDQFGGTYQVRVKLTLLSSEETLPNSTVVQFNILGDAGEITILSKEIYKGEFSENGDFECIINYTIKSTPKVGFGLSVANNCVIAVNEIECRRVY